MREEVRNPIVDLKIDLELKALIPAIKPDELSALEQSIINEGCRDPLIVWDERSVLLDGHNRYEICTRLDIPFNTLRYQMADRLDAEIWMRKNQAKQTQSHRHPARSQCRVSGGA